MVIQNVYLRKCLETLVLPTLPCSTGKDFAPTQKWTIDLSFVTRRGDL